MLLGRKVVISGYHSKQIVMTNTPARKADQNMIKGASLRPESQKESMHKIRPQAGNIQLLKEGCYDREKNQQEDTRKNGRKYTHFFEGHRHQKKKNKQTTKARTIRNPGINGSTLSQGRTKLTIYQKPLPIHK